MISYAVAQRTREIGIRMALGAQRSTILRSVLRRASMYVLIGGTMGIGLAWMLSTTVANELFRVAPHDLRLYAVVGAALALTAIAAAYVPARRAALVDPLVALRSE
jgi:ABC-type antimicrobial peptide transport system permease subunit